MWQKRGLEFPIHISHSFDYHMTSWQWTIFTIFTTRNYSIKWPMTIMCGHYHGLFHYQIHHVGHDLHIELPTPWQLPSHILYILCTPSTNTIKDQQIIVEFVYLLLTCMFCCHYLTVGYIDNQSWVYIIQIMWRS